MAANSCERALIHSPNDYHLTYNAYHNVVHLEIQKYRIRSHSEVSTVSPLLNPAVVIKATRRNSPSFKKTDWPLKRMPDVFPDHVFTPSSTCRTCSTTALSFPSRRYVHLRRLKVHPYRRRAVVHALTACQHDDASSDMSVSGRVHAGICVASSFSRSYSTSV